MNLVASFTAEGTFRRFSPVFNLERDRFATVLAFDGHGFAHR